MIMRLKDIHPHDPDAALLRKLNNEAFPDEERIDADELFRIAAGGRMDILGIYPDERFAGFFAVRTFGNVAYIAFFAVCPEERSKGVGGAALGALKEHYKGRQIIVDFESVYEENENPSQRLRRREFYLRNGFHETGRFMFYCGTEFEIFCSESAYDRAGFEALIRDIHEQAPEFDPKIYRRE